MALDDLLGRAVPELAATLASASQPEPGKEPGKPESRPGPMPERAL